MRALLTAIVLAAGVHPATATCGTASWYGLESGRITANGESFNGHSMTAASRTLPFGAIVDVTVIDKRHIADGIRGNRVRVRINDRGPAASTGRIIDLAELAGQRLGITQIGTAEVCLQVVR